MHAIIERLASGRRWWIAEAVLRLGGTSSLVGACALAITAHRLVVAPPPHQPAPSEFLICLAAVVLLSIGLALVIEGPGLFRRVPRPPRALLP